jgi:hypothetical protein
MERTGEIHAYARLGAILSLVSYPGFRQTRRYTHYALLFLVEARSAYIYEYVLDYNEKKGRC